MRLALARHSIGPFNCPDCGRYSRESWLTQSDESIVWGGICSVHGRWQEMT